MLDIGWSEMLVIGVVAVLVVGPRELPSMLRTFGKYAGQLRRMAGEFQSQFNDALKEAELDEVKRGIESVRSASPANQLRKELGSFKDAANGMRKAVEDPAAPSTPAAKPEEADGVRPDPAAPVAGEAPPTPAHVGEEQAAPVPEDKKTATAETAS